ncbi:actin-related protein 2/3 complex subunit 1A-A-like [Anthonomus grandis grandis]|uniref:actin-related protein 2/3 complex subunit 1A-A-like n=1 Tax=Anthonomus grandis grandis TaxID=2921223 RepID=UPI0021656621|nr:actin-related protein 2/3 complex subunit 1A-A-like [Anthonomus grandis grandis]
MSQCFSFGPSPIPCHSWNKDRSQIAFSPGNNDIEIHQNRGQNWSLAGTLKKHDLRVTSLDWAPKTNKIVSCSADRNAYVWTEESNGQWSPTLVLLRINRAATCVKWSPNENKFAIGSGSRLVAVAYYEKENDWWVSRHIKKSFKSTVTTLDWHPNNMLLATGSTDFRVRVFSGYIKDVEEAAKETAWGSKEAFGQLMAEYVNSPLGGGWIHCVAFSPDGNKVAWVSHDSSINVADPTLGANSIIKLPTKFLPFLTCIWTDNGTIVAGGHDCQPLTYTLTNNNTLTFAGKLDKSLQKKESQGISALSKFRLMEKEARSEQEDKTLESAHQNPIACFCVYQGVKGKVEKISSSGLDGRVVIWTVGSLERSMKGLKM